MICEEEREYGLRRRKGVWYTKKKGGVMKKKKEGMIYEQEEGLTRSHIYVNMHDIR